MILTFLNHRWKSFWRARGRNTSLVIHLVMGLIILYLVASALFVGYALEELIAHFLPGHEVTAVFNGLILYYFGVDFLLRIQLQELPALAVKPYLHLKIPRRRLISFLNISALLSPFNLVPLLLFSPFCILHIGAAHGMMVCGLYLISILALTLLNNYGALYAKRLAARNFTAVVAGMALLAAAAALEYFKLFSLARLSSLFFNSLESLPALVLVFPVLAAGVFLLNDRFLYRSLYLDALDQRQPVKSNLSFPLLSRFGAAGELAALEIRLILRNKRPRSTVLKGLLFLCYGLFFYKPKALAADHFGGMLVAAIFMTGNTILLYGQFMFGWQSAEFDGLLARRVKVSTIFRAKLLLMTLSVILLTLLSCAYGYLGPKIILLQLAAGLYNAGAGSLIVLYFATRNDKGIDLSKGSSMNWQGTGAMTMLMALPVMVMPLLLYWPVSVLLGPYWGLGAIALAGLAGCCTRGFWTGKLEKSFNKRKYQLASGFREH